MQNVIAFPKAAVSAPAEPKATGSKTLFLHIRRTTLIMHLAAPQATAIAGDRIGRRI